MGKCSAKPIKINVKTRIDTLNNLFKDISGAPRSLENIVKKIGEKMQSSAHKGPSDKLIRIDIHKP
ncbi:MAG: hypothetical protein QXT67_07390 [Candidatus Bathyarchaeia archaeon]